MVWPARCRIAGPGRQFRSTPISESGARCMTNSKAGIRLQGGNHRPAPRTYHHSQLSGHAGRTRFGAPNRHASRQQPCGSLAVAAASRRAKCHGLLREETRKPGMPRRPAKTVSHPVPLICGKPPGEATHWTGRAVAAAAGIPLRSVERIREANRLQPNRSRTFKRSRSPKFNEKPAYVVHLHLNPPAQAMVLPCNVKSRIQALDRTDRGDAVRPTD